MSDGRPSQEFRIAFGRRPVEGMADRRSFERRVLYAANGRVGKRTATESSVKAKVRGSSSDQVLIWIDDGHAALACSCPVGVDGKLGKQAVALALVATGAVSDPDQQAEAAIDVRAYLAGLDQDRLVDLLVERAAEDEVFDARLRMSAARVTTGPPPIAVVRHALDEAFVVRDRVDYPHMYDSASTINSALDSLQELLDDGHAEAVIALAEHAIDGAEDALGYVDDSDGYMSGIAERLQESCAETPTRRPSRNPSRWRGRSSSGSGTPAIWTAFQVPPPRTRRSWALRKLPSTDGWRRQSGMSCHPLARGMKTAATRHAGSESPRASRPLPSWPATSTPSRGRWPAINRRPTSSSASPSCTGRRDGATMRRRGRSRGWRCTAGRIRDCSRPLQRSTTGPVAAPTPYGSPGMPTTPHRPCALAWAEARSAGCPRDLSLELARRRERGHPLDAIPIWQGEVERVIEAKNNQGYAEAVEPIVPVRRLLNAADREADFPPYLAKVRAAHKPKRNLMQLFDERSW